MKEKITNEKPSVVTAEFVLVNSHDRSDAYQPCACLFRFVCFFSAARLSPQLLLERRELECTDCILTKCGLITRIFRRQRWTGSVGQIDVGPGAWDLP